MLMRSGFSAMKRYVRRDAAQGDRSTRYRALKAYSQNSDREKREKERTRELDPWLFNNVIVSR